MIFSEKLSVLRKSKGFTQEELSEKLGVSRQAVAKWESGQSYPDIMNLIEISELFSITVDYLVKDRECAKDPLRAGGSGSETDELIKFRLEANRSTYAAFMNEVESTRENSHDYRYERDDYVYHDTYVGGEKFAGEEAIWKNKRAVYAMNYMGRVLDERFSGNFLKEALRAATPDMPYRGPSFYQSGEYVYQAKVTGDIEWFCGQEEIFMGNSKIYECYFHGGTVK